MATSLQQFIDRTRRIARDWPDQDAFTASVTSGSTTLSVADTTLYFKNQPIEVDQETMIVRALTSGTVLTVKRGAFGSTAASHVSGSTVLIGPRFLQVEIIDAINNGIDNVFPLIYKPITMAGTSITANTYEYTIPNMDTPVIPVPYISLVETQAPGDPAYRGVTHWDLRRGATPKIRFKRVPVVGSAVRIHGFGPFPHLSALSDTTDTLWPYRADTLPVYWAASELLASGEALRVRTDTIPIDARESATRPGSSMAASNAMLQRFYTMLRALAMPPMPKTVKSVI